MFRYGLAMLACCLLTGCTVTAKVYCDHTRKDPDIKAGACYEISNKIGGPK